MINPISQLWNERHEPLHRNAVYWMLSIVVASAFGFFFWMIVARNYSVAETGIATALISAMSLLFMLSRLGFDFSLVRFLPSASNKNRMMNTCMTISALVAVGIGGVFVFNVGSWTPELAFLKTNAVYTVTFIAFCAVCAVFILQGQVFMALRSAKYTFFLALINGLRLPLAVLLVGFGVLGVFSSFGIAMVVAFFAAILFIRTFEPKYKPTPTVDRKIAFGLARYSVGNYVASDLAMLPSYLMPLIIVSTLGAEANAYYYIGFCIAGILGAIATGAHFSMIAESSYEPDRLRVQVVKALRFSFLATGCGVALLFFLGKPLLHLFSPQYAEMSLVVLRVASFSWLPAIMSIFYLAVARIRLYIKTIIVIDGALATVAIGVGYALLHHMGIVGVAVGFLVAQAGVGAVSGWLLLRELNLSVGGIVSGMAKGKLEGEPL